MTTDRDVLTKLEEIAVHLETAERFLEKLEPATNEDLAWKKEALKRLRSAQDEIGER